MQSIIERFWTTALKNKRREKYIKKCIELVDYRLSIINRHLVSKRASPSFAPIFIIGAPRTGSTFLYQILSHRFQICYFSNLMMAFPKSTLCIAGLFRHINDYSNKSNFYSTYGNTSGWDAPNQGWRFWTRFFHRDQQIRTLSPDFALEIRNTVLHLQNLYNMPFINKWQRLTTKLPMINNIFPDVVFLVCTREAAATARSILQARRDLLGDENKWFSTKTENYDEIKTLRPIFQVCEQVRKIEETIDRQIKSIGPEKFTLVRYEDVVSHPKSVLDMVNEFYHQSTGVHLKTRNSIPSSFRNFNLKWNDDPEYIAIKSYLQ